jgi:hypothetical protein
MRRLGARLAVWALALASCAAPPARAFLGVADTSLVTVIANPAEAANWAAQLERLNSQLVAASATLEAVSQLRAYAGDPKAALAAVPELADLVRSVGALAAGGQTAEELLQAWQAGGAAQRLLREAALLQEAGAGATMDVFGAARPRDSALYSRLAADAGASSALRGQIAGEQSARRSLAAELSQAWGRFRSAQTESGKQAVLVEISQLQSQDQLLDARRRAVLDDLALSDRQERTDEAVRSRAADEQLLAESALLDAAAQGRARDAQAGRMATLGKGAAQPAAADYAAVRTWTTADAGGAGP